MKKYIGIVVDYISSLSAKDSFKIIIGAVSVVTIIALGTAYFVYARGKKHVTSIRELHTLIKKSSGILAQSKSIGQEEDRIEELLQKNRDFNIKSYFEQFCRSHGVTPEPNWETTTNPIEGNDKFEEVVLPATFGGQTTEKLVTLLDDLDKEEIVYLKELAIRKEPSTIAFDLTIATKKMRRVVEE